VTACAVGIDFGTESGRALLLDLDSGAELAAQVVPYSRAVIDRELPSTGERLPPDWALQDPEDWMAVVRRGVPAVLRTAGISGADVVGLGVDFTSCTVLPVEADGTPLCQTPELGGRRHAWPKLWKHHSAQPVADRLTEVAQERGETFLARYGGRISSEWYFPKLIELWLEDRELYARAGAFIEATDWMVWQLTGRECRQACTAGYKAMWHPDDGLPPVDYFTAAYPGFDRPSEKLGEAFAPLGHRAGAVRPELAAALGLGPDVAVAVGNVDSFVSVPGAGVHAPGSFVMVIGTSICDMLVGTDEVALPGITGVMRDGILPGLYGYEAGQVAVGDMLAWLVRLLDPAQGGYAELEAAAAQLLPGECGLVALDWWNGNRSILADADLTGVIAGLTLQSSAADIYRAQLESIAHGNRRIVENFVEHGLAPREIVACGGIAHRSPLLMQLLCDSTGLPLRVPDSREVPARGAAMFGAVAAGHFSGIEAAVRALAPGTARSYNPRRAEQAAHDHVYAIYRRLHDLLGAEQVDLLHTLKALRTAPRGAR
jgi:L-ribulokinase